MNQREKYFQIMEADDFTIVKHKRRRKGKPLDMALMIRKSKSLSNALSNVTMDELERRVKDFKVKIDKQFLNAVIHRFAQILSGRTLIRIRAIGLGNFGFELDALAQLVLLLYIKTHFNVPIVISQEPRTTAIESLFMKQCGIIVLPPDDLLKVPLDEATNLNGVTLLYMIHSVAEMYDSVLSSYWEESKLKNLIILGNQLKEIAYGFTEEATKKFPVLCEFANICENDTLNFPEYSFYLTAFSFIPKKCLQILKNFCDYRPAYDLVSIN